MFVFVYTDEMGLQNVFDAEGTIDPGEWASVWGVRNYPNAIYFFGEVMA